MRRFSLALRHYAAYFPSYFSAVFLLYAPWLFLIAGLAMAGVLTNEAVQAASGIVGIFMVPLCNGVIVWLFDRHERGERPSFVDALRAVAPRWKDLLAAFLSVGLILFGWIALAAVPTGILTLILQLESPLWFVPLCAAAAIYVMARYAFLDFLIIYEGKVGWVARRAAPERTNGSMLPLLTAVILLSAPLLFSEFGYEAAANWLVVQTGLSAYLPHPTQLVTAVFTLIATLLYVIPQRYFYQVYKELDRAS